jgi:hypothetical protein
MQLALICSKCGKIHNEGDEATLVIDFHKKQMSFICQNKSCKYDNMFTFDTWQDKIKTSPLPRTRII